MLSVVTVLLLVVAIMNTANFLNLDSEASILLDILAENNGSFGMRDERVFPPGEPPEMPQDDGTGNSADKNYDMQKMFEKSEETMWECRNCGHLVIGKKAPDVCPVCNHPQSYFEVRKENY